MDYTSGVVKFPLSAPVENKQLVSRTDQPMIRSQVVTRWRHWRHSRRRTSLPPQARRV